MLRIREEWVKRDAHIYRSMGLAFTLVPHLVGVQKYAKNKYCSLNFEPQKPKPND